MIILFVLKVILFYFMIITKKINKKRYNVESCFVGYLYVTFSLHLYPLGEKKKEIKTYLE